MGGTCGDGRKVALTESGPAPACVHACVSACVGHTALQNKVTAGVTRAADTSSRDYRRATPPGAMALAQAYICRMCIARII